MSGDRGFMRRALQEARKGLGRTSPNPCVGAVVVHDQKIIATGYHQKAGTPHAEIHALNRAGDRARGATLFVTLEPCNHFGRTPPCTRAIVASGIKRVVVGMRDPNPLVDGGGIRYLQSQEIEVTSGVLETECQALNRPFVKHITTGLPWVILKAGMSLDGRISYQPGQRGGMTSADSLRKLHRLRDQVDAILVGKNTVLVDDPSLTTRLPSGKGKDPIRVILDTHLHISPLVKLLHQASSAPTWIFCGPQVAADRLAPFQQMTNVKVYQVECGTDGRVSPRQALITLARLGVCSVLVEGGAAIHGAFLNQRLVDEARLFIAPLFAGNSGTPIITGLNIADASHAIRLHSVCIRRLGADCMVEGLLAIPEEDSISAA